MSSLIAVRALRSAINSGNLPWRNLSTSNTSFASKKSSSAGSSESQKSSSNSSSSGIDLNKNLDPPADIFEKDPSKIPPGVSKDSPHYKNPEYFQYHPFSFAELDVVMAKFRLPQPSAK